MSRTKVDELFQFHLTNGFYMKMLNKINDWGFSKKNFFKFAFTLIIFHFNFGSLFLHPRFWFHKKTNIIKGKTVKKMIKLYKQRYEMSSGKVFQHQMNTIETIKMEYSFFNVKNG